MARPKKNLILSEPPSDPDVKPIKVQLDARTTVMLKSMKNFAFWKEKYPEAKVVSEQ